MIHRPNLQASAPRPNARTLSCGSLPRSFAHDEAATAMIEMAVSLPVMLALLFCFMQLCLAFYSKSMISESAREGTRYAIYHGASCPTSANPTCEASASQVNNYVSNLNWPNLAGGTMTVNTTYPSGSEAAGSQVQVQITYVLPITMPFVPANSLTMTATSKATIIQ